MSAISTHRGEVQINDDVFEGVALRFFQQAGKVVEMPGPAQLDELLQRYRVDSFHYDWARSIAQRALTKLLVAAG